MEIASESKLVLKVSALSAVLTLILLMFANYFFNHTWNLFESSAKKETFSAQGSADIKAVPDQAQINFAVSETAKNLDDAKNQANARTNQIVGDLQNMGIAQNDIKTSAYNSYPNYDQTTPKAVSSPNVIYPGRNPEVISSYTVNENVTINVSDTSKANAIIDLATKDGAQNIYGPDFSFSDAKQKSLENEARIQAINDAKQKAQDLANAAGIKLGKVTNVQENDSSFPRPLLMKSSAVGGAADSSAPTQINPGENTITQTVTVSFEIK